MLTRPFTIRAKIQHGDKVGRDIGYPTANMDMGNYLRPRFGIYAVTARIPGDRPGDERVCQGAANLGIRPTFDPPKELLETHLFDFTGDLYGKAVDVELRHFLRPEAKFGSLDALVAQMDKDCERARELLSAPRND